MMVEVCLFHGEVKLVPYTREHDARTVEWLNSLDLRSTFGLSQRVTIASHRAWVEQAGEVLLWAVLDRDLLHQGNVLLHLNKRHRNAYFQIYLGNPLARGRGLGSDALTVTLDLAFTELRLNRVWLHTLPDNAAAEALYRSAGFVQEGLERESVFRDGGYMSQFRWSLLTHEWATRRGKAGK